MHCYILCLHHDSLDTQALSEHLRTPAHYVEVVSVNTLDFFEAQLKAKSYDLAIVASPFDQEASLDAVLSHKIPTLIYVTKIVATSLPPHAQIIEQTSMFNLARIAALYIGNHRTQAQLETVGAHIKELTVTLEYDNEGGFVYRFANSAFLKNESLTIDRLLDKRIEAVPLLFDVAQLQDNIYEVYESGDPLNMPSYFYMKAGAREWVDLYIFKSNRGEVTLVGVPLTEMKRAHDKVEESRRYLQTLLNAQAHMVYITDGIQLINANKAFLDYFECETMHGFKKRFKMLHDMFEPSHEAGYIGGEDMMWLETVAGEPDLIHKVRIAKGHHMGVFVPSVQIIEVQEKKQYVVVLTDITELESEKEKLRVVAMTDPLTGIANRLKFNTVIEEQLAMSHRYRTHLSVLMLDIDYFKQVNDNFSHQTGDAVLKAFVELIDAQLRQSDLFIRWGGEEFLILLTNTSLDNAHQAAEKLRKSIEKTRFEEVGHITSSFGVTTLHEGDTLSTFIARADEALYQAKRAGRNRTQVL